MKKIFRMAMVCALAGATLVYTGCTKDYSEDIYELNQRVSTLENDTRVAKLQEEVGKLTTLVGNLQTAQGNLETALAKKADNSALTEFKTTVEQTYATKAQLQSEVTALTAALQAYATKSELQSTKEALSSEIVSKIEAALEGYYTKDEIKTFLEGKTSPADVEAMLSNYYTKDQVYSKGEVYTKAEIEALKSAYYTKEMCDQKFPTKGELSSAIASAIQTVEGEIAESADTLNSKIVALESRVELLEGDVETIKSSLGTVKDNIVALQTVLNVVSNMVQSVTFVPEYSDLCATAKFYGFETSARTAVEKFGWKLINSLNAPQEPVYNYLPYAIVNATFQVKPERLATAVKEAYDEGELNVYLQKVNTKSRTRAAEDYVPSDALKIVEADNTNGYLTIQARFDVKAQPTANDFNAFSSLIGVDQFETVISLWIENADTENKNPELGTNVASAYVPVVAENVVVEGDDFVYVKEGENGFEEYSEGVIARYVADTTVAWNLMGKPEALVDFHKDFNPAVVFEGDTLTIAEFAAKTFVKEADVTPAPKKEFMYVDVPDKAASSLESLKSEFDVVDTTGTEDILKVSIFDTEEPTDAIAWVGDYVTSAYTFTLPNGTVLFNVFDYYRIGWIEERFAFAEACNQDWTYDFAVKHSSDPTKNYGKPGELLENKQALVFADQPVPAGVDGEALEMTTPKVYDAEGQEVEGVTVKYVFDEQANTVDVQINGYEFGEDAASYVVKCEFPDVANKTKATVTFNYTLGAKPQLFAAEKDIVINYLPTTTDANVFPAEMSAVLEYLTDEGSDATELQRIFADNAEFLYGLAKAEPTQNNALVTTDGTELVGTPYTYIALDESFGANARLAANDVHTYRDTYVFTLKAKTWYNVDYKLTVNASIKPREYALAYWPDMVNLEGAPYAILKGKYATAPGVEGAPEYTTFAAAKQAGKSHLEYVINTDDLSKYYRIEGKDKIADSEKDAMTIVYKVVTKKNVAAGYDNVPEIDETAKDLEDDFGIPSEKIAWNNYSARDLDVIAELYCNKVLVNSCPLTLNILDPISKFEAKSNEFVVNYQNYYEAVAYLWKNFTLEGVLEPGVSLINNDATDAASAYKFDNPYSVVLSFDDSNLTTYIGDQAYDMVGTKITYDAENGKIEYHADASWMQKDVKVAVKASLKHKFNYLWDAQSTAAKEKNHVESVEFMVIFRGEQAPQAN